MRIPTLLLPVVVLTLLPSCGSAPEPSRDLAARRFDPIVGGVADNDALHDAVVMVYNAAAGALCTGTIISQSGERGVVVTARHCVSEVVSEYVTCKNDVGDDYAPDELYILKGSNPTHSNTAYLGNGEKIFHTPGTSLCNADFAVIVMHENVSGIVPLRVRTSADAYVVGEKFTAIGYGLTNPNHDYSSGKRYLREDVTVTALGPKIGVVFSKEFQGTASICSGDSGGPAVSADWAIIGVTSRGASCYGNDNIWTRVDSFKDTIDEAMAYAGSTYVVEEGAPPWPDDIGDAGGSGGAAGAAGAGGSSGAGDMGTGGGDISATGGSGGSIAPPEPVRCGSDGPCAVGSVCVEDPATGNARCVASCSATRPCNDGTTCNLTAGLCTGPAESGPAIDGDVSVTGGCAASTAPVPRHAGAWLAAATAWLIRRRRKGR